MMETSQVEWKREFTEDIKKELVAFANTQGGELLVGIADDGSVQGVISPDKVSAQITNMIRDAIRPDMSLITYVEIEYREEKPLIRVRVNRGTKRPYYIAKKGMTSAGVFVRQGNTSAPASKDAIREMIRETDGYSFESYLSFDQNLTFEYCSKIFAERNIQFEKNQMQTLKIINFDGLYTNLGLLLSDQCFHSIQFACFQGTEIGTFVERQKFSGSILKQLDEAYAVMSRYNRTRSEISGLHRTDSKEYPEGALREALINSVVHRDYDRDVSTNIRVFDDRIEIASYGGLPANTTIETFLLGLSIPRNKNLADVFYRLELIEAFGSGIPKMTDLYQAQGKVIVFKTSPNGFMVSLPSLSYQAKPTMKNQPKKIKKTHTKGLQQKRAEVAIDLIKQKGPASRVELEEAWGIGRTVATRLIKFLVEGGELLVQGDGKDTRYDINRNLEHSLHGDLMN